MRTILVAAIPVGPDHREWGARGASFVFHLGLIALAVWYTQAPEPGVAPSRDPGRPIIFSTAPEPSRPLEPPPAPPAGPPIHALVIPEPGSAVLPAELVPPVTNWLPSAMDPPGAIPGATPEPVGPPVPPGAAPMDVAVVEEAPVLLSHPSPGYPELLRRAGIEGRVVVEAVVDTMGMVERGSLRILSSTHGLFAPEASALVLGSRYRPARSGGRAVRVRIRIPVTFSLRR